MDEQLIATGGILKEFNSQCLYMYTTYAFSAQNDMQHAVKIKKVVTYHVCLNVAHVHVLIMYFMVYPKHSKTY